MKINGQTSEEWAEEYFRYSYCECCGLDRDMHDIIPGPTGNWFAKCKEVEE